MYHPDGIEVLLQPTDRDENYEELVCESSEINGEDSVDSKRYIKGATGERFAIVVSIYPNFCMYSATGVTLSLRMDEDVDKKIELHLPETSRIAKDRTHVVSYRLAHHLMDVGGAFREHTWHFAELEPGKEVTRPI